MSQDYHTPASRIEDPPTVAEDREAKKAQRQKIAALFLSRPLEEITPAELRRITPHYQQRISELRRQKPDPMLITNVPQSLERADGSKQKLDGNYRLDLEKPQGPPSHLFRPQKLLY